MITRDEWVKSREKRDSAAPAILDYIRLTEPAYEKLPLPCSPGYGYEPVGHQTWKMSCKRRNCEECGWYWACKWRNALKEKARNDYDFGKQTANKALTLTFAENVDFPTMQNILRQFWKFLRRAYPDTEYWGVVEFNQTHTIPHLHFIINQTSYIELDFLDYCWRVAQKRYKLEHLAWNLRIERIRKNTQAYFTKYITKLTGGKDEVPRRTIWAGRYVRYSAKFFPLGVPAMLAGRVFNEKLKAGTGLDKVYWYVRKPLKYLKDFQKECRDLNQCIIDTVNKPWDPLNDRLTGSPLPEDDLLTGIETIPVYYVPEFNSEFYAKLEHFNYSDKTGRMGPAF